MRVLIIQETAIRFDACFVQHLNCVGVEVRFLYKSPEIEGALLKLDCPASFLLLRGCLNFRSLFGLRKITDEFTSDVIHAGATKNCFLAIVAQPLRKRASLVLLRGAFRNINPFRCSDSLLFRSHWVDVFRCVSQAIADSLIGADIPRGRSWSSIS